MIRTRRFHCLGSGFDPAWGTKILQATWHGQNKKTENQKHKTSKQKNPTKKYIFQRFATKIMSTISIILVMIIFNIDYTLKC